MFHIFYKLSKSIAIIYHARPLLHQCALRNLYCALILPYISHHAMVWGNTYHQICYNFSLNRNMSSKLYVMSDIENTIPVVLSS